MVPKFLEMIEKTTNSDQLSALGGRGGGEAQG